MSQNLRATCKNISAVIFPLDSQERIVGERNGPLKPVAEWGITHFKLAMNSYLILYLHK